MECRAYLLAHGAAVNFWQVVFKIRSTQNGTRPPVHPWMPRRSWELDRCSCDSQRNMKHAGRLGTSPGCKASVLATTVIRALREGRQAPLRMLARSFYGTVLSGGARSIFLLSSVRFLGIVVGDSEIGAT